LESALKNQLILTGAAGFIGSQIARWANAKQIPLLSVDELHYFTSRTHFKKQGIDFGETLDLNRLESRLNSLKTKPRAILHMGACSNTMETDPAVFERLNLNYSKMLWSYASTHKVPFLYASSAATYGEGELGYSDEESQISSLKPLNLYGMSKQNFDLWALDQEKKGNSPPAWSGWKFFNVYGPGENHKGNQASVVFHAWNQIKKTGQVKLFKSHRDGISDGHQKRDFVFVEDVVQVLAFALEKPIRRGIFNLGTGKARSFLDLARATFQALRTPEKIEFIPTPESIRDKYQYFTEANMQKLRREGYQPEFHSLEEGVSHYVRSLETTQSP